MMPLCKNLSLKSISITLFAALFITIFAIPELAFAESTPPPEFQSEVDKFREQCQESINIKDPENLKIIQAAVNCFEGMVNKAALGGMFVMHLYLRDAISAALMLYIIIFGAKIALMGSPPQKVRGELFVHGLKVGFVTWLVLSFGVIELWTMVTSAYTGLINIVLSPASIDFVDECEIPTGTLDAVWATMDCILSRFVGWNVENGDGGKFVGVPLLFGFVTDAIGDGLGGFMFAAITLMAIWALIMSFFKAAFVYILSMLALILLFIISPLIIPMLLFPQTKQFFEGWYKLVISMVLQPVLLFAFLGFILVVFDEIVNGDEGLLAVYKQTRVSYQPVASTNTGTSTTILQWFDISFAGENAEDPKKMKEYVFSLITTLITAFLLLSFINFVGRMGHELAGLATAPDLSGNDLGGGGFFK